MPFAKHEAVHQWYNCFPNEMSNTSNVYRYSKGLVILPSHHRIKMQKSKVPENSKQALSSEVTGQVDFKI
jgi:hypothetical protein